MEEVFAQSPRKVVARKPINVNQVPEEITSNAVLNSIIKKTLPANYNFEVWHEITTHLVDNNTTVL